MTAKVLIADDEEKMTRLVASYLENAGFATLVAKDGKEALGLFQSSHPDCVVLDISMPGMDGLEVARQIRQSSQVPIIFLSALAEESDRIVGLELGADDYLAKPFSVRELVLRMSAVLRRGESKGPAVIEVAELRVDRDAHRVEVEGSELTLTALEFKLLTTLVTRRERVQRRSTLLADVWEVDPGVTSRTVDTHVKRLRDKLGAAGRFIQTVRGVGYRFSDTDG